MYNARKNPKLAKNIRSKESEYSKVKSYCSCPTGFHFKNDQSNCDDKFNRNNGWIQAAKESEKFLRGELQKYGLAPKTKKATETKHYNSPKHGGRVDINLRSVPEDSVIKVNIKEILCRNKYKSKTEPNLPADRYAEDLKKEIKSKKREIPCLPEKYKKKYLKSLKEELLLNKLTTRHDENQQLEDIKKEIETYRSNKSQFEEADSTSTHKKNFPPTDFTISIHHRDKKRRDHSQDGSIKGPKRKGRKGKNSEAGDGYDRICSPHCDSTRIKKQPTRKEFDSSLVDDDLKSIQTEQEIPLISPAKNYATIATQCEIEIKQTIDITEGNEVKKFDVLSNLIPEISSVIEKSEKKLEQAFQEVLKHPKIVHDRGVSPIKEIVESSPKQDANEDKNPSIPQPPPNSPSQSLKSYELDKSFDGTEYPVDQTQAQPDSYNPHIGDLLINIESIRDSRCILNSFQHELLQLKKDIENCGNCREGKEDYCEKHVIYIPLLRVGEVGSRSDQIKLFHALKTEVSLKKEIESLIQHISNLERRLARAKKGNDQEKTELIGKELEMARSYFDNLLIKQQNERLLRDQQKIMKDKNEHECKNKGNCDKCCLDGQIHDLLGKIRASIAKDIEDSKQRLKIQKMPTIDIRKPLQLQNILKLDIPPSKPPQMSYKNNFVYEAVVKDVEDDDSRQTETTKTKIAGNRTTSFELSDGHRNSSKTSNKSEVKTKNSGTDARKHSRSQEKPDEASFNTEYSETSSKYLPTTSRRKKLEKTPSQMGFRRNVASQCDSSTSIEQVTPTEMSRAARVSAQTQTVTSPNESSFLFGFKEYLMKNANPLPNLVDVNLQVSMDESNDSVVDRKSLGVNTEHRLTARSCEFGGVIAVSQSDDESEIKCKELLETTVSPENSTEKKSAGSLKQKRSITRSPSLKKMFLPSETHEAAESPMQNPYVEPKYKMKRFSVNRQESELEGRPNAGDAFYKSLTDKEELPERKVTPVSESRPEEPIVLNTFLDNVNYVEEKPPEQNSEQNTEVFVHDRDLETRGAEEDKTVPGATTDFNDHLEHLVHTLPKSVSDEKLYEYMEDVEISKNSNPSLVLSLQYTNNEEIEELVEELIEQREEAKEQSVSKENIIEILDSALNVPADKEDEETIPTVVELNEIVSADFGISHNEEHHHKKQSVVKSSDEKQVKINKEFIEKDEQLDDMSKTTVLPVFSRTFKVVLNRSKDLNKSDGNVLLIPVSDKSKHLRISLPSRHFSQQTDQVNVVVRKEPTRKNNLEDISELYSKDKFIITKFQQSTRGNANVNYILHKPNPDEGTSCKTRSGIEQICRERMEYSTKCSKLDKSVDSSSLASSEGEVKCKCKNVNEGEFHDCPRGRKNSNKTGIHYKENLSSHLVLEKERKHYQHWVTYYATKKDKDELSSSSVESEIVNNK